MDADRLGHTYTPSSALAVEAFRPPARARPDAAGSKGSISQS